MSQLLDLLISLSWRPSSYSSGGNFCYYERGTLWFILDIYKIKALYLYFHKASDYKTWQDSNEWHEFSSTWSRKTMWKVHCCNICGKKVFLPLRGRKIVKSFNKFNSHFVRFSLHLLQPHLKYQMWHVSLAHVVVDRG